jgi:hypothetical protein
MTTMIVYVCEKCGHKQMPRNSENKTLKRLCSICHNKKFKLIEVKI